MALLNGKELINGFGHRAPDLDTDDVTSLRQNGVFCLVANGNGSINNCSRRKKATTKPRDLTTIENETESETFVPTRTQLLSDWANLCTFLGAILATVAMASMWKRNYYLGMVLNVLANIADIIDGPIARSTPNRHPTFSTIGSKLDCYSDTVSHFVVPASLLMTISDLHPVCVGLASLYICTGIMRQSYFEVTGRCAQGSCIYGVTSDYMVAIYSVVMHLLPVIGSRWMTVVLSATVVGMMFCCLTFSLRSRRYDGFDLVTATIFNVLLCGSCAVLNSGVFADLGIVSGIQFAVLLLIAYPLYFRFVEINR